MGVQWQVITMATFVLLLLASIVSAVDRGNFKTCDQSGFCKRHRAMQPNQSPYVVLMDSVKILPTKIEVQVLNTKNDVRLLLELFSLDGNMARLKVNELSPLKPRFEVPHDLVIVGDLKESNINVLARDRESMTLGFLDNKIMITSTPFRIDFIVNNEPVMGLNTRGLMKFEHVQIKKEAQAVEENQEEKEDDKQDDGEDTGGENEEEVNADEKEEEQKEEEETLLWEETFKTHTDSKPNGPMSLGIDISFPGFEHVYGIPEHADSFALKSTKDGDPYRLYNLDVFEYEMDSPMALYGAVPVMIAHNAKRSIGVFWLNSAEMWIDIRSNIADKTYFSKMVNLVTGDNELPQTDTHWFAESGVIDIFIILGPTPADIFKQYAALTGTTPLPPLFAMSYHQCRWNYNDQDDIKNVDNKFDEHDIPYDVIWLDIEHTDGKRYFTWDATKFPDSTQMVNDLSVKGRKLVNVVDPHLKRDDNYHVYSDAKEKGFLVKDKAGNDYEGWCWPGSSAWPDFVNPEVRTWWADHFALDRYHGTTNDVYVWNDMNEPSVFSGPEGTMHKDAVHYNGWEHRDTHNVFSLYVHAATWDGLMRRMENKRRPFLLVRGFFAGSQKFGSIWTGDNAGDWSHLKATVPMMLSLSVTGITFSGADVGGFFKNPDPELLTRWYQAGAYQPFFRAHAHLDTRRREPWLLPEQNMYIVRDALRARYALLPYWYTLFYENERTGMPPMRPLWVEFPDDKKTFTIDHEYMLGSALLVKPIVEAGATGINVFFPGKNEIWYDVLTWQPFEGDKQTYIEAPLNKIPVFQRGGSIISRKERIRRSSTLTYNDPFTLIICLDKQGRARGELYVDDYNSFNYKNGEFIHREFQFENNKIQSVSADPSGHYSTKAWIERIVIIGINKSPAQVLLILKGTDSKPLAYSYTEDRKALLIRKPGVNIEDDWSIMIM